MTRDNMLDGFSGKQADLIANLVVFSTDSRRFDMADFEKADKASDPEHPNILRTDKSEVKGQNRKEINHSKEGQNISEWSGGGVDTQNVFKRKETGEYDLNCDK